MIQNTDIFTQALKKLLELEKEAKVIFPDGDIKRYDINGCNIIYTERFITISYIKETVLCNGLRFEYSKTTKDLLGYLDIVTSVTTHYYSLDFICNKLWVDAKKIPYTITYLREEDGDSIVLFECKELNMKEEYLEADVMWLVNALPSLKDKTN